MESSDPNSALPALPIDDLSPLEQDVLDEYERLAENMKKVRFCLVPSSAVFPFFVCVPAFMSAVQGSVRAIHAVMYFLNVGCVQLRMGIGIGRHMRVEIRI